MSCKPPYKTPGLITPPSRPLGLVTEFTLDASEIELFDHWVEEHVSIYGVEMEYYHYDRANSIKDPVYNEPIRRVFQGPYKFKAYFSYPENSPEAREEGLRTQWFATIWIPRKTIERARAPEPDAGDVFRVWDTPYFRSDGNQDETIPKSGFYFEATDSNPNGMLFDRPAFVAFQLEVTRRSEYTPERFLRSE